MVSHTQTHTHKENVVYECAFAAFGEFCNSFKATRCVDLVASSGTKRYYAVGCLLIADFVKHSDFEVQGFVFGPKSNTQSS